MAKPSSKSPVGEVPQLSIGFFTFELLYNSCPQAPLDIETWGQEVTAQQIIIKHIAYMQNRITTLALIVCEHMNQDQEAQSRVYNLSTKTKIFKE